MWDKIRKKRFLIPLQVMLAVILGLSLSLVGGTQVADITSDTQTIGVGEKVFTIGVSGVAYAAGTPDYACDGVADDVQFQLAFNALPAAGGKIVVLAGDYSFNAAVTRAINNVTIEGMGRSTYLARDGANPIFTTGVQNNWTFINLRFDAGGVNAAGATHVVYENVYVGVTYYAYDTSSDITADEWLVPVGRAATFVVASSNSSAAGIAQADYVCDGTSDETEINAAINALPVGGGTVLLLEGTYTIDGSIIPLTGTHLMGQGPGTVIFLVNNLPNPGADWGMIQATAAAETDIHIFNLTLDGNRANQGAFSLHGFYFSSVDYWSVKSCTIKNVRVHALKPYASSPHGLIVNNIFINNILDMYIDNGSNYIVVDSNTSEDSGGFALVDTCQYVILSNNTVEGNATLQVPMIEFARGTEKSSIIGNVLTGGLNQHGIYLHGSGAGQDSRYNLVEGNYIRNFNSGILIKGDAGSESSYHTIAGNVIIQNGERGIYLLDNAHHNLITGNYVLENSQTSDNSKDNIFLAGNSDYNTIVNNVVRQGLQTNDPKYGVNISAATCNENLVMNNDLYDSGQTANINDAGTLTHIQNNKGSEITDEKVFIEVKNTSGSTLVAGNVTVLKAVAAGNEITITTAQGDDKVYGMVAENITNNNYGLVLVLGKTTILKVDGTDDIAIGDLLGTFTTAGISMKAAAGDMAFAIALEAYTTNDSNGVIDALLITPRKV